MMLMLLFGQIFLLIRVAFATTAFSQVTITGSSTEHCEAQELKIRFKVLQSFLEEDVLKLSLPGFTSSADCSSRKASETVLEEGLDIYHTEENYRNTSQFQVRYIEGTLEEMFYDSYLEFEVVDEVELAVDEYYIIKIDGRNNLQFSCKPDYDFTLESDVYSNDLITATVSGLPTSTCFLYDSKLQFHPKLALTAQTITVSITPAMKMTLNDEITVNMPGFYNTVSGATTLIVHPLNKFSAEWNEGSSSNDYEASYLSITLLDGTESNPGEEIQVKLEASSGIMISCGIPPNETDFLVSVSNDYGDIVNAEFVSVDMIGQGCANECNGNGECDYCLELCSCYDGFGSSVDVLRAWGYDETDDDVDDDNLPSPFARDCSDRSCPYSHAILSSDHNLIVECSGAGICDRATGQCDCFDRFTGSACERMRCPSSLPSKATSLDEYEAMKKSQVCSGRGECLPMRQLIIASEYKEDWTDNSWDSKTIYGCKCDSSWTVGYGDGEVQLVPEWFGPACEYRQCPSGDNPDTDEDEEDCEDVNDGEEGNLCHVECSNRGLCDYSSGTCSCFDGYTGWNCNREYTTLYS